MSLTEYRRKRQFGQTREPEPGKVLAKGKRAIFVVQLHFDLDPGDDVPWSDVVERARRDGRRFFLAAGPPRRPSGNATPLGRDGKSQKRPCVRYPQRPRARETLEEASLGRHRSNQAGPRSGERAAEEAVGEAELGDYPCVHLDSRHSHGFVCGSTRASGVSATKSKLAREPRSTHAAS